MAHYQLDVVATTRDVKTLYHSIFGSLCERVPTNFQELFGHLYMTG
jgi:hypothetical protein